MSDEKVVVAVDAMGGDDAPGVVLDGVAQALASDPALEIVLCGPADVVEPFAAAHERCTPQACSEVIAMAEHPANAVRKKKDSSIVVGCRLVKEGAAQGFFSAGSTGACLAAGTLVMGRIKGVARPALATVIPSPVRPVVMCDIGANADCKPEYLVHGEGYRHRASSRRAAQHRRGGHEGLAVRARSARPAEGAAVELRRQRGGLRYPSCELRRHHHRRLHGQRMPEDHRGHVEDPVQDAQEHHDVHAAHEAGRSGLFWA